MLSGASTPAGPGTPTIEAVQRDIGLANQYRLELIKLSMTLAAGVLAFTVSFRPALREVVNGWLMWLGWIGLGLSMVGGMVHMHGWDRFYVSYRDHDWKGDKSGGKAERKRIAKWRTPAMLAQFGGFALGVLAIGLFAAANLGNVAPPIAARP